ncbi:unnamed protein product [Phytophthora fragariaefolia]|uniref:Unnamed protein product n=1 Tax=Phytophthora fragariaefolia TaxID=1490495 RepID=A0A9W6U282_9STRA|nr:unnamed protein product [Phytophthora fragariaefolia]
MSNQRDLYSITQHRVRNRVNKMFFFAATKANGQSDAHCQFDGQTSFYQSSRCIHFTNDLNCQKGDSWIQGENLKHLIFAHSARVATSKSKAPPPRVKGDGATPRKYSDDELEAAVQAVLAGSRMTTVRDDTGIPYNTLKKYVSDARKGVKREKKRPGPKPLLPKEAEENLREWVLGRQHTGHPVVRQELLEKAQQIAHLVSGLTVGEGWLRRFMERHPSLALRASQSVSNLP